MDGGALLFGLVFIAAIWVFFAWPTWIIGQRFDLDHKWMAFVPLLSFFVLTSAAGLTHWFVLVIFIPFLNWLVAPILFTRICRATDQNEIKGWLTIVPLLGWVMTWAIAYDAPWNSRPL